MKIFLSFFLFVLVNFVSGQAINQGQSCGCDVLLSVPIFPEGPNGPNIPNPEFKIKGDLFEFEKFEGDKCIRTVEVFFKRKDGFEQDFISNDIYHVLDKYDRWVICLQGDFVSSETIIINNGGRTIKLLQPTTITYTGDGSGPLFDLRSPQNTIRGSSGAQLITGVPMPQGVIRIMPNRTDCPSWNPNYPNCNEADMVQDAGLNQIKDLSIINTSVPPQPLPADARTNRGIFLNNNVESINNLTETSSNYWCQLSDLDIEGFSSGIHLRGWSNVATIRNISFKNISGYGIWLSGTVDNSIAEVQFESCSNATAIRLDNYVNEIWEDEFSIGGETYELASPNERIEFSSKVLLENLFDNEVDFGAPITSLKAILGYSTFDLRNSTLYNDDPLGHALIRESCLWNTIIDIPNNNINRFGFFNGGVDGFEADVVSPERNNFHDDGLDLLKVRSNGITGSSAVPDPITFYKNNFDHETWRETDGITPVRISMPGGATCHSVDTRLSNFFLPPAFNAFTRIRVIDNDGNMAVAKLVEISPREDGDALCLETAPRATTGENPAKTCIPCQRDFKGGISNAFGFRNTIVFCSLPSEYNATNPDGSGKNILSAASINSYIENNLFIGSTQNKCSLEGISNPSSGNPVPIVQIFSEN